MKPIRSLMALALFMVAMIVFPLAVQAAPVGSVTHVQGRVDITSPGEAARPANVGDELEKGDIIRTKRKSKAEITFADGNILRLAEETRVEVTEYMMDQEQTRGVLSLFRGKLQNIVGALGAKFGRDEQNRYEVHTATAVCGVRGTNFFAWFLKGVSGTAFQEGEGYVYSKNRPDEVKTIHAGQTALVVSADQPPMVRPSTDEEMGKHSEDTAPLEEEEEGEEGEEETAEEAETEEEIAEEEEAVAEEEEAAEEAPAEEAPAEEAPAEEALPEGYTPPEDEGFGALGDTDTGDTGPDLGPDTELDLYIPPDITPGPEPEPESDFIVQIEGFSGEVSGTFDETTGTGTLNITGLLPQDAGNTQGSTLEGTLLGNPIQGYIGGVVGSWEGLLWTIYDKDGDVGYLYGSLSDPLFTLGGTLNAEGDVYRSPALGEIEGGLSESLSDWNLPLPVLGSVNVGGAIDPGTSHDIGFFKGLTATSGGNLGVWGVTTVGTYSNDPGLTDWSGAYGQSGTLQYGNDPEVPYYILGEILGTDDGAGHVTITSQDGDEIIYYFDEDDYLTYMDPFYVGKIGLEYRGTYDEVTGEYESVGAGTYMLIPLAFRGGLNSVSWATSEQFVEDGSIAGLMGGITDLWNGTPSVTLMGRYTKPNNMPLWAMNIGGTTTDGGAFLGLLDFSLSDNNLTGHTIGLYIKPNGDAGYLTSSGTISGTLYPGIGMWEAGGSLTAETPMSTTSVLPEDLSWDSITQSPFYGSITDGDFLNGDIVGQTYGISGQDWGIFGSMACGETNEGGYWIAYGAGKYNDYIGNTYGYYLTETALGSFSGGISSSNAITWTMSSLAFEETPLVLSGYIDAAYIFYDFNLDEITYDDYHYGLLGTTESPFVSAAAAYDVQPGTPGTPVDITLMGESYPYGLITWEGYEYLYGVGEDNSEVGYFIGGRTNHTGSAVEDVEGILAGFYIDNAGNAGTLSGSFAGSYFPALDMWQAEGTVTATQRATGDPLGYSDASEYIDGYLYGYFDNGGAIYNDYSLYDIGWGYTYSWTWWLEDSSYNPEPWGIFNIELGGYYDTPTSDSWTLILGGDYWRDIEWPEYWFATVTGTQWSDQRIAGTLSGRYLTPTVLGTIEGNVLGSYDTYEAGLWEAVALGTFEETPLAFSGYIDYADDWDEGSYYGIYADLSLVDDYDVSYFDTWNDVWARVGGVTSPWTWDGTDWQTQTVDVVYMGEYYCGDDGPDFPYIWNDDIYSYNDDNGEYTTFDNGAFKGFIGGVWRDKAIDARVVSLYMDPGGNIGYLTGSLEGTYHPEFYDYYEGLLEADGTWTPTRMASAADVGINPADFYDEVQTDPNMTAKVYGTFGDGDGYISGEQFYYYYYYDSLTVGWTRYIDGQNWGIYDIILDGYGSGSGYDNPNIYTSWSAKIGGKANFGTYDDGDSWASDWGYWLADITAGTWDAGKLSGSLDGVFLTYTKVGIITGDVLGYYDDVGNWAATSLGTWEGLPLAFSGDWGDPEYDGGLYYYNGEGGLIQAGQDWGLIGSLDTPLEDHLLLAAIGQYYDDGSGGPYIWTSDITGNELTAEGYFQGFTGGIWKDGAMDGAAMAIYVNSDNTAGILTGDLSGSYYDGIGMWMAGGVSTYVEMPNTTIGDIEEGIISPTGDGSFSDGSGITVMSSQGNSMCITEQGWGIWGTMLGGIYTPTTSTNWTLQLIDDQLTATHWLEVAGSTTWPAGGGIAETSGNVAGAWVDLEHALTGVIGGEAIGTFNPTENTWQAVAAGSWLETSKFLGMAAIRYDEETATFTFNTTGTELTDAQNHLLNNLNIPCIEVGRTDLTGTNGNINVTMNDVTFFAYSTNDSPRIWATHDVNGGYQTLPAPAETVTLSGTGFDNSVTFTVDNFTETTLGSNTGTWAAGVTGSGTVNSYDITIDGGAAGDFASGSFDGTGAGVASPQ